MPINIRVVSNEQAQMDNEEKTRARRERLKNTVEETLRKQRVDLTRDRVDDQDHETATFTKNATTHLKRIMAQAERDLPVDALDEYDELQ